MTCRFIDGTATAKNIRKNLVLRVAEFISKTGVVPSLTAIVVGNDPASKIYVKKKMLACQEVGINGQVLHVATEDSDLLKWHLMDLNENQDCHAYILQLPLPKSLFADEYFSLFNPLKDVDVFHPENVGLLVQGRPRFRPCTPHGIQVMLHSNGIKVAGKKVVVINRSNVVGKPLSSMLIQECNEYANATVTVCHDHTPPDLLKEVTKTADIVIVAVGKPGFLTADMVRPGVGVVDVGISRIDGKVVGDVHPEVYALAEWATPVPGGVGPMTVAMLLENTLTAASLALQCEI